MRRIMFRIIEKWASIWAFEGCYSDDVFFFPFEKRLKFNKEDSR